MVKSYIECNSPLDWRKSANCKRTFSTTLFKVSNLSRGGWSSYSIKAGFVKAKWSTQIKSLMMTLKSGKSCLSVTPSSIASKTSFLSSRKSVSLFPNKHSFCIECLSFRISHTTNVAFCGTNWYRAPCLQILEYWAGKVWIWECIIEPWNDCILRFLVALYLDTFMKRSFCPSCFVGTDIVLGKIIYFTPNSFDKAHQRLIIVLFGLKVSLNLSEYTLWYSSVHSHLRTF